MTKCENHLQNVVSGDSVRNPVYQQGAGAGTHGLVDGRDGVQSTVSMMMMMVVVVLML